ncbi:MAG: V-type ATP synthase subunit F [Candidatus Hodarchaeales archaeon]|jgi:vacuolar-type H+-ATPase subunit F/Vma7
MQITAIADERTCTWLRMSGIGDVYPINQPTEAADTLKALMKKIDIAIILITPEISQANTKLVQQALSKKDVFPIVLELPMGEDQESTQLQDLISSALGIEFKV